MPGALIPEQALQPLTALLSSKTPLEDPPRLQHVASAPVLNNLNMRNLPSPTFAASPLLMPHTNSVASFRTIPASGFGHFKAEQKPLPQPQLLSGASSSSVLQPMFRVTQPAPLSVAPKFRVVPAKPKTPTAGSFSNRQPVRIVPPVAPKPSFTVMESPEDEFKDMPIITFP